MMLTINVIVETPKGSNAKYDRDPKTGAMVLNKVMPKGLVFPYDFGFVPDTIGDDGDPLDVLVISEVATFSGCMMECKLIGAIKAAQKERNGESMRNDRLIAVPVVSHEYATVEEIEDLPPAILDELEMFFENYNEQAGKKFKTLQQLNAKKAMQLVEKGRKENDKKLYLIHLFLPVPATADKNQQLGKLKEELTSHFGGVTIFAQKPVIGEWLDGAKKTEEELLVFEIMACTIEVPFLEKLKTKLEKQFDQKEILIRCQQIGVI